MSIPKWSEERTQALVKFVGDESPVSQETVAEAAENLETSTRSVSSKLRKLGYTVDLASTRVKKAFTDAQEAVLEDFVKANPGQYTYAEIAEHFEGGAFSAKSIQGKILSMELTELVKPTPKQETVRTFTEAEEKTFVKMVKDGAYLEDIAKALGKEVNQVRGKALSLLRFNQIDAIPRQQHTKGVTRQDPLSELGDVSEFTVEEIAEKIGKSPRGVRTMLTRRGIVAANYDGAARKEKAAKEV